MATPAGRPTYGGWLDEIARQGRTDDFGHVATAWANAQANGRPKIHAPRSVNKWLAEHPPPGVGNLALTLHQLEQAYHNQSGLDGFGDGPPATPQPASHQQPDPAADQAQQDWFTSPEGQAWLASPNGQEWMAQQNAAAEPMVQQYPAEQAYQQPEQPAEVPEHPWQMVLLAVGRLETQITTFMQVMAPLIALAGEAAAVDTAIQASAAFQPSPAQVRAQAIAAEHGWTPGPEIPAPQPPSFYGSHVVAQPNFAAMADASDGTEDPE